MRLLSSSAERDEEVGGLRVKLGLGIDIIIFILLEEKLHGSKSI